MARSAFARIQPGSAFGLQIANGALDRYWRFTLFGGYVEFTKLATGAWVLPSWRIRMPIPIRRTLLHTFSPGYLKFEQGPSKPVTLQWATYYDAADQAGLSRIYGGIHIATDDVAGRRIGSRVGKQAWALAERYFAGNVR